MLAPTRVSVRRMAGLPDEITTGLAEPELTSTTMRHLTPVISMSPELFQQLPQPVSRALPPTELGPALGATLYTPATTPGLAARLRMLSRAGVVASVVCLEDSVADGDVAWACENLRDTIKEIRQLPPCGPLVFLRVRSPDQIGYLQETLDGFGSIDGIVLPKFGAHSAQPYLDALNRFDVAMPFMPILEEHSVLAHNRRACSLAYLRSVLDAARTRVIAVRFGSTDLSGLVGVRRGHDRTLYDLPVIVDALVAVLNTFTIEGAYTVSGPVFEYYGSEICRASPLIRETLSDLTNGLTGKTIIHPTHALPVDACHVVAAEDFRDAQQIVSSSGGVSASPARNKMNEAGPHRLWATRILERARWFGVRHDGCDLDQLLRAAAAAGPI